MSSFRHKRKSHPFDAATIDLTCADLRSTVFQMFRNHPGFSFSRSMIFSFRFPYIFADVDFSSNFF